MSATVPPLAAVDSGQGMVVIKAMRRMALVAWLVASAGMAAAAPGWDGGYEGLRFSIRWLFVPAGVASIEANPLPDGRARLVMTACSYPALDLFYKVRDRIDAEVAVGEAGLRSRHYEYRQHEGRHRGHQILQFLPGEVDYRDLEEGEHLRLPIGPGTLDMVAAFFATRSFEPLAPGRRFTLPVFDQKKFYELEVEVIRRETLPTLLGEQTPAVVIQPKLKTEGIFKRTGDMFIWLSDDQHRLPLRMESHVRIGKVVAELIERRESADWADAEYRCPVDRDR